MRYFPMEDDVKKDNGLIQKAVETRVGRLESQVASTATEVSEVASQVQHLCTRTDGAFRAMREETRERERSLLEETRERERSLREEILERNLALRQEMREGLRSIRDRLSEKELSDTRMWAILIGAALLGAAAHGFHWI
jgi:hypothetical protein